jgi:quercetin dioxygenase-like cupin family protein
MKLIPSTSIEAKEANEGASKLKVRWLITEETGAPNFAMRLFEMAPNGFSPKHTHPWEHEVFILEGEGTVLGGKEERKFKAGDAIFVPPDELHQFRNTGTKTVKFLCLVPI